MADKERRREQERKRRAANPEKYREQARKKYWENKEAENARARKYHAENRDKLLAKKKEWYQENKDNIDKEARKEYARAYYLAHPEKWFKTDETRRRANALERKHRAESEAVRKAHRAEVRKWQRENPEKVKASRRLKAYGITLEEFLALLAAQDYKCAICGYSDMSNPKIFPFVDHCHNLNHVRGILCCYCNHGIGHFRDSPVLLRKAAKYLQRTALFGPPETNREKKHVQ